MLKLINLKNLTAFSFMAILATGLIAQPAASNANSVPVGIDSLDTTDVDATSSTSDVCEGNSCADKEYGTGTNIRLNGFTVGDTKYSILQLVDEARFQRVDNDQVSGNRHIYFLETGDNDSIGSSAIFTMEDAVRSDFINGGTDNVFANDGGVNLNNIERVDFIINSGLIVKEGYIEDAGFLLLERGGNDPFKMAAIKGIDANGNPNQFGDLIDIPKSTWGNSGIGIRTSVLQNQSDWDAPVLTASLGRQNINGIFVSTASLGLNAGETIYGYALFPGDIDSSNDLVGLSDFPGNTSASSGQGGLDLISSGGLFIPKDISPDTVFEPASAVNDQITTDEDSNVSGNVLTNDIGDSLIVTTTGQQTLSSGALVTINSDGTFTYNPNSKFEALNVGQSKTDTFNYTMKDGNNNISSATVTVNINGAADSPVAKDDTKKTDENNIKWIPVLKNDEDPNTARENLTITKVDGKSISVDNPIELDSGATIELKEIDNSSKHRSHGKYTLKYDPTTSTSLNELNDGEKETETFTYIVSDPEGNIDQGSVTITVDGITDSFAD